ncbi:hypothetical protein AMEX_G25345 [Astyanax mexicanus]|uniref:Uncharacterized protein n=1 Tax=Astyanax mexicanus TaxID=7994 RepID=A0A8T2KSW9_ASTMX|nr:hypothetical protein AMEX_G25345 [Astyanax mexicanus]
MQDIHKKVFTSAMEFTDDEKAWLLSISAEIPVDGKLTSTEECLRELAKPKNATEAHLFQILGCIRFGLMEPVISDLESAISSNQDKRSLISYHCG